MSSPVTKLSLVESMFSPIDQMPCRHLSQNTRSSKACSPSWFASASVSVVNSGIRNAASMPPEQTATKPRKGKTNKAIKSMHKELKVHKQLWHPSSSIIRTVFENVEHLIN